MPPRHPLVAAVAGDAIATNHWNVSCHLAKPAWLAPDIVAHDAVTGPSVGAAAVGIYGVADDADASAIYLTAQLPAALLQDRATQAWSRSIVVGSSLSQADT